MKDMIYEYDGSFDGFLCCVYESYTEKENPTAFYVGEDFFTVFETRYIATDPAHAGRVYCSFGKTSKEFGPFLRRAWLTDTEDKELLLYRLIRKFYRVGPSLLRNLSDETLAPVLAAVRHLNGEAHLLRGFVRFSELGGVLGAEIEPKNRVLPILRTHFCNRFREESFFIFDRTHKEILLYSDHHAKIMPMESFVMAQPDNEEANYRLLWKRFYDTVAIRERENLRGRMSRMPKRYWNTMTEFQPETYFTAADASIPADEQAPAFPDARPAPVISRECGHSAPA